MPEEVTEDRVPAEGYTPIAVRDDIVGNTVISFNTETRDFILAVSGKMLGPVTLKEVEALTLNLQDVIEMKGRYLFIQDYDAAGNQT